MTIRLTVVLAVQGGIDRLPAVLDTLRPQCGEGIQVLVCYTEVDRGVRDACRDESWVTLVAAPRGSLIPHLWRTGILRADAPRVALTVVHCRPEPDWIATLLEADLERFAGVGGAIDNDPRSDACGWAVYMLRYLQYARPFSPRETADIPGDNVVYDRRVLLAHADAFADGFWEPRIHTLLLRHGYRLLLDPAVAVIHSNGYGVREFSGMRLAHGRRYGRDRAAAMPNTRRLLYLAVSPAAPLVLLAKVVRRALGRPTSRRALLRALPALLLFVSAWGAGEVRGVMDAVLEPSG